MRTRRALIRTSKYLYELGSELSDSSREFVEVLVPGRSSACRNTNCQLMRGLLRAGFERGKGKGGRVERLCFVVRAREWLDLEKEGSWQVVEENARVMDGEGEDRCECATEPLFHMNNKDRARDLALMLAGLREIRVLVNVRGWNPPRQRQLTAEQGLRWMLVSLLHLCAEAAKMNSQRQHARVQVAMRGERDELRIFSADPFPSKVGNLFNVFDFMTTVRANAPVLILPHAGTLSGLVGTLCGECKPAPGGPHMRKVKKVRIQAWTIINRIPHAPLPIQLEQKSRFASIKAVVKRGKKSVPYRYWEQYMPVHIRRPTSEIAVRLSLVHLEGVLVDGELYPVLALICTHHGRLVLRNVRLTQNVADPEPGFTRGEYTGVRKYASWRWLVNGLVTEGRRFRSVELEALGQQAGEEFRVLKRRELEELEGMLRWGCAEEVLEKSRARARTELGPGDYVGLFDGARR